VVKVWELQSMRCINTIDSFDGHTNSHVKLFANTIFSSLTSQSELFPSLIVCSRRPLFRLFIIYCILNDSKWTYQNVNDKLSTAHQTPIINSVYSSAYDCVITCDKAGIVNVWNMQNYSTEKVTPLINTFLTDHSTFTVSCQLGFSTFYVYFYLV
jgi:WD40 repeat protein